MIFSPYFVLGDEGVLLLTDLEERGVQVRAVTNSLASTDVGIVHAGYAKYREPLLQGGVEIYELKPDVDVSQRGKLTKFVGSSGASLHAKTFVYDRTALFVGSPNLDPRSGKLNTELGILFASEPLAKAVAEWSDANWARIASQVSLDRVHCGSGHQCGERLQWTGPKGRPGGGLPRGPSHGRSDPMVSCADIPPAHRRAVVILGSWSSSGVARSMYRQWRIRPPGADMSLPENPAGVIVVSTPPGTTHANH